MSSTACGKRPHPCRAWWLAGLIGLLPSVISAAPPGAPVPAAGLFLVAGRDIPGRTFQRSVVLLVRHGESGTLGVVINRRTGFHLDDLLPDLDSAQAHRHAVHLGGPVAPHLLLMLLHQVQPTRDILAVTDEIQFSAELPVLESLIRRGHPPERLRCYVGHAGWAPGQLERELAAGHWWLVPADAESVFATNSADVWERLIDRVDPPGIRVQADEPGMAAGRAVNRPATTALREMPTQSAMR